ncbi:4'-phosphopantetheinyl transferase superfamily protein [Achromobacter sp. GG226]|uniref:4'-phosphopantetheinyl transferase family protein n=1 Tax=Verticiella alkaliphila TaxID=2779529 RepID=UPI001C0D8077|nr:4'-phosphopantetheinyl transferase superfamily protein [Verticiella sp. GG226]MBU4612316.1 4'-phosphopantetheinyl transferase superfamily protein [Verticiella sp. GG226]
MLHVHILPVADDVALSDRLLATLTSAEQARIDRLRQPADRRRSLTARAALRALLSRLLGVAGPQVPLMTAPSGQPIVAGTPWHVSLAHSGECAIVAVASTAVGVDVESDRDMPDAVEMARTWFTAAEATRIAARPADFLPLWTAKEAVLKAAGTGLAGGLAGFAAPVPSTEFLPLSAPPDSALTRLAVRRLDAGPGYHAALCVQTPAAHALREHRHDLAWLDAVAHTGVAPTESEIFHGQT